jgi:hypothetical protein
MSKHTPGPWANYGGVIRDLDGGEDQVAVVDTCDESWEANANLIAASPELLKALSMALADADQIVSAPDEMELDWIEEARAAIAKARGEA